MFSLAARPSSDTSAPAYLPPYCRQKGIQWSIVGVTEGKVPERVKAVLDMLTRRVFLGLHYCY